MTRKCYFLNLGLVEYSRALELQELIHSAISESKVDFDVLMLLEHPDVITLGKSGDVKNILVSSEYLSRMGIPVYKVDRGGDVTYHGPGQLIGYPIISLQANNLDVMSYLDKLARSIINLLAEYNINSRYDKGIWVGDNKIAAIGISVHRGVTKHGFALYVNPKLEFFEFIIPCGIKDKGITSLRHYLNREITVEEIAEKYPKYFSEALGLKLEPISLDSLLSLIQ